MVLNKSRQISIIELVKIADGLEMQLMLKDRENGKSKRNMTEEEKKVAQEKSMRAKARNARESETSDNK